MYEIKLAILIFIWFALVFAYIVVTVVSVIVAGECNRTCISCSGSMGKVWSLALPRKMGYGMNINSLSESSQLSAVFYV
jgi:hypothetical protein